MNDRVQKFVTLVRSLKAVCDDMADKIQSNKAKTQDLLTKTAALQDEKCLFLSILKVFLVLIQEKRLSEIYQK